jgi:hypothetical protein
MRSKRSPIPTRDVDGREVFLIPLANTDLKARIFPEDYHRLLADGWSSQWVWNYNAVKVNRYRANLQRLCRLVTNAPENQQVRFRDRNPLNLRSDNLFTVPFKRHKPQAPKPTARW